MADLINTIVEPADKGSFVSKADKNPYRLDYTYSPRDYQRAAKKVYYCYDNGRIEVRGIGHVDIGEYRVFDDGKEILRYHDYVYTTDNIRALNSYLLDCGEDEFLTDLNNGDWTFDESELSARFLELVEYLKNRDVHTPPEPFRSYGFLYYKENIDGETCYYLRAITEKEGHKEVE